MANYTQELIDHADRKHQRGLMFDPHAARDLANQDPSHPYWAGEMRQTLLRACDIVEAAKAEAAKLTTAG